MTETFTLNNQTYKTDAETLQHLRSFVAAYKAGAEAMLGCVTTVMGLGLKSGRIVEVTQAQAA